MQHLWLLSSYGGGGGGLSFTGDVCRPWFQENRMVHWDLAASRAPPAGLWGTVRRMLSLRRPRLRTRPRVRLIYLVGTHSQLRGYGSCLGPFSSWFEATVQFS